MSETKTLKIFEPLKTYFQILCNSSKCENFSSAECKELINMLTTIVSDEPKCTENFIGALESFAYELKKADAPISLYTIKGELLKIFTSVPITKKKDIVEAVNNSTKLNGFKMSDNAGEGETYEEILNELIKNNEDILSNKQLFNKWVNASFKMYDRNKKYFKDEIMPALKEYNNLSSCEKKLLTTYFNINVDADGTVQSMKVEEYVKDYEKYKDKEARLNSIALTDKSQAKITELLPDTVWEAFNNFLISPPGTSPEFVFDKDCYKNVDTTKVPDEEKYIVPKDRVNDILKWFENTSREINRRQRLGIKPEDIIRMLKQKQADIEDKDKPDHDPYVQGETKLYFPDDFKVEDYKNKWGLGVNGQLYKKEDGAGGEFKLYSKAELKADAEKFKAKDGKTTCGNLCIFDKPDECEKFFEKLIKGNELTMDELSKIINDGNFASSYSALQSNIADVNPLFVVGTLKLFGFQKFTQIDSAGRKIIKIESFTNWWNRQNKNAGFSIKLNSHGSHNTTNPSAPANVELFFKLLINFINSNEFVLNPRDKRLMTKSGEKPKASVYSESPEYVIWTDKDGKEHKHKNILYKGKTSDNKMSLSDIEKLMKTNSSFTGNSIGNKMSDNVLNLSTLLGLMTQMTSTGNFSFLGKAHTHLTGMGYVGGGDPEAGAGAGSGAEAEAGAGSGAEAGAGAGAEGKDIFLPCAANALGIYTQGGKALAKNNKKYDSDGEIIKKIYELAKLELEVADDLEALARVVKIINVMGDKEEKAMNSDTVKKLIEKCGKNAEKCATKSDSIIFSILEKIW